MPRDGYTPEEDRALEALGVSATQLAEATGSAPLRVPRELDEMLRAAARARVAPARAPRPKILRMWHVAGALAVAATVLIALSVGLVSRRDQPRRPEHATAAMTETRRPAPDAMDIDGNGTVDILDAFRMSRALDGDEAATRAGDFDGDGKTDLADVDAVAVAAVSL